MKTKKEEESVKEVAQVIFRHSAEHRGYYLFYYGHITSEGTFAEASGQSFSEFLVSVGIPGYLVSDFVESFDDSDLKICVFGYLSQKHFDSFMRSFFPFCDSVQLYPGMLVLTY